MVFSYTILLRRPGDKMPNFYGVENFYPLAMGISRVIPVLRKILTQKVAFAQQMPTILYSAFTFKEVSVSIPTEFDSNWQSPFGFQMLFYSNSK